MTKKTVATVTRYLNVYLEYKRIEKELHDLTAKTLVALRPGEKLLDVRHEVAHILRPNEAAIQKAGYWRRCSQTVVDVRKLHALLAGLTKREARKLAKVEELHRIKVYGQNAKG